MSNHQNEDMDIFKILLAGLAFRLLIALSLVPGFDEAYYYLYSQHLDWSYFDHPVLVALVTGFGPLLTGITSPFTLRLGTLILFTASLYLLYLTGLRLFDAQAAKLSLIIASLVPIFLLAFGVLTLPDGPLIFFWTASLYVAVREFFNQKDSYTPSYRLLLLGALVALACLSKYHGFILALGLLGFCLSNNIYRRVFSSAWGWLAIAVFFLTLFPLWFWNLQHDWVSFRFQLSTRFDPEAKGFSLLKVFWVFLAGIGYLFPSFGLPLWCITGRSLGQQSLKERLVLWVSLPLTLGFTLLGGTQQILAAWPMPGFWCLTLLLGKAVCNWPSRVRKWWLRGSALTIVTIMLVVLAHVNLGIAQKSSKYALFGGFISSEQDPARELIDFQQLRDAFTSSPALKAALAETDFIFTNAYYLAGLIDLAMRPLKPIPVTCFSYDIRGFAYWYQPQNWLGQNGLYITLDRFAKQTSLTQEYSSYFVSFRPIATVPITRAGVIIDFLRIYQGLNLQKAPKLTNPTRESGYT